VIFGFKTIFQCLLMILGAREVETMANNFDYLTARFHLSFWELKLEVTGLTEDPKNRTDSGWKSIFKFVSTETGLGRLTV
jgi:hypothetical protein